MVRIPAVALSLVLAAVGLSGCALFEEIGDDDLDDALELVPGDATSITFRRLGIDDNGKQITGGTEPALSELDIVWMVTALDPEGVTRAYKVDEELDLDAVGDDLADAGYTEDEIAGHRHLFNEDQSSEVVLVPDEHLIFVGRTRDTVETSVDVFEDDADSVTDKGTFDDVLAGAEDPEFALLAKDPDCSTDLTPEQVAASGTGDLGTPETTGFFMNGDDAATTSVLAFADEDDAEADLAARETYLDDGLLLRTREPMADLAEWEIERDGHLVKISYEYDEPKLAARAAANLDGFHACNPSG